MDFLSYITENALILIPVLYIIGAILKGTDKIQNKYIPAVLLPIGIIMAIGIMGMSMTSVVQGVLVVGASVYANQMFKQCTKKD